MSTADQNASTDLPFTGGGDLFTVEVTHTHAFRRGWGVDATPIYAGEPGDADEDYPDENAIVDVDVQIVRIDRDSVRVIGHVPCVPLTDESGEPTAWAPVENFKADASSDMLDGRWFETLIEAVQYANTIEDFARRIRGED